MSAGRRDILTGSLFAPLNHSRLDIDGEPVWLVSGNRSSWKNSVCETHKSTDFFSNVGSEPLKNMFKWKCSANSWYYIENFKWLLTLTRGTVTDIGSIEPWVRRNKRAISTARTSHIVTGSRQMAWCRPSGLIGVRGNRCGNSSDTSYVTMLLSPCHTNMDNWRIDKTLELTSNDKCGKACYVNHCMCA